MPQTKTLLTRNVKAKDFNKLKKIAKDKRLSMNSLMLHVIDYYIGNELSVSKKLSYPNPMFTTPRLK